MLALRSLLTKGKISSPPKKKKTTTLPQTNMAPENRPSQKETSIPTIHFQGRTVSFREGINTQNILAAAFTILQLFICQRSTIDTCWVQTPRSAQVAGSPETGGVSEWELFKIYVSLPRKASKLFLKLQEKANLGWWIWGGVPHLSRVYLSALTPPETNSKSPCKSMVGKCNFLLGRPIFRGELLVSGRVYIESIVFEEGYPPV